MSEKQFRLFEGDCLEVMQDIPDNSIDMVLTDPPYGTTRCKWDSVIPLDLMWAQLKRIAKPRAAIVLTASQPFTSALIMSNLAMFKYCWVWHKNIAGNFLNAARTPMSRHEDVCVFYSRQCVYNRQFTSGEPYARLRKGNDSGDCYDLVERSATQNTGQRNPISVLEFDREVGLHPTQKPVALMEYMVRTYTHEGETVLDFTMGSGTTGVACKNLGRDFIGIELDPEYSRVAQERIA